MRGWSGGKARSVTGTEARKCRYMPSGKAALSQVESGRFYT